MQTLINNIQTIVPLIILIFSAMDYKINKELFRLILELLFAIYMFGFLITYKKHIEDLASKMFVLVDYGFVLLCFVLFLYMINKAAHEED